LEKLLGWRDQITPTRDEKSFAPSTARLPLKRIHSDLSQKFQKATDAKTDSIEKSQAFLEALRRHAGDTNFGGKLRNNSLSVSKKTRAGTDESKELKENDTIGGVADGFKIHLTDNAGVSKNFSEGDEPMEDNSTGKMCLDETGQYIREKSAFG